MRTLAGVFAVSALACFACAAPSPPRELSVTAQVEGSRIRITNHASDTFSRCTLTLQEQTTALAQLTPGADNVLMVAAFGMPWTAVVRGVLTCEEPAPATAVLYVPQAMPALQQPAAREHVHEVAVKLATIQAHRPPALDLVEEIEFALSSLERKCQQASPLLGEMVFKAQKMVRTATGNAMSLSALAHALDNGIDDPGSDKLDCSAPISQLVVRMGGRVE